MRQRPAYDNANRLTTVTDWNSRAVAYAYDDAGRMTTTTLPASTNIVSSYAYDNADRLTSVSHVKNGSTTIASASYTLDAVGNRTQRVDQQGTHNYSYDNAYRLTSVTYPGPATTSYTFDAFGNRTSKTEPGSQTTTYAHNDGDRLTSVTPPGQSAISYTWDNNGDLTARGSDSFSWDYEDRMTSATVGGTTTTFAYHGDGLRHSKTTGGNTTTFTWDVNAGLPVVLDDGNQYVYGGGLEAMVTAGGTYYYLADGLGSTMAMVDTSGTVQKSYTYDVYGKATPTGSLANEFDFAGQETDGSTGLQYLRARYMDPATGTFVSREPMAVSPGWTGNHYGYGGGNPARYTDPTGLRVCEDTEGPCEGGVASHADRTRGAGAAGQPIAVPAPTPCVAVTPAPGAGPGGSCAPSSAAGGGRPVFDLSDVGGLCAEECAVLILGEYEGYHFGTKVNRRHLDRLRQQGWTSREITDVLLRWDEQIVQSKKPGLTALLRHLSDGTTNVIIRDSSGVIQGSFRKATRTDLLSLAEEFGWVGFP